MRSVILSLRRLCQFQLKTGHFLLLIVDGLDEVISKAPQLNIDDFISSIIRYNDGMGNGKIIITCRSYFWERSKYNSELLRTVELLPFSEPQTKNFFEKSFMGDKLKIDKCLILAEEFKFKDNNEFYYHPYVLEVIRTIVESNREILKSDGTFNSSILEKTVKSDYIIYRMCYREKIKVEQISVDDQVKFFSYCLLSAEA